MLAASALVKAPSIHLSKKKKRKKLVRSKRRPMPEQKLYGQKYVTVVNQQIMASCGLV